MGKNSEKKRKQDKGNTEAERADKYLLYEQSVQSVEEEINFVDGTYRKIRKRRARKYCEDFCATMNTSREWVKRRPSNVAYCVDRDPEPLDWGKARNEALLTQRQQTRIHPINADVRNVKMEPVDIVSAMNFSTWFFTKRKVMKSYFRRVYNRLDDEGIFFLDAFGGYEAFTEMKEKTKHKSFTYVWDQEEVKHKGFTYIWDQEKYNPITGDFLCHIHFKFKDGSKMEKAFTCDFRLWTLPEITEILEEVGFKPVVYWDMSDNDYENQYEPSAEGEANASWVVYIVAVK